MDGATDGLNEKKLVARPRPFRISVSHFSPDGQSIAFATGQSVNQADDFSSIEINLETGAEHQLTLHKFFFNIKEINWLPEKNGWLVTAKQNTERNFRICQLFTTGEVVPLTKDSEIYSSLSLDNDPTQMVSPQRRRELWTTFFRLIIRPKLKF